MPPPSRLAIAALLAGLLAVVVLVARGGGGDGGGYRVSIRLANASGLRDGGQVVRGGESIGKVRLHLGHDDVVVADLVLDDGQPPITADSRLAISTVNLLGRKRIEVLPGRSTAPLPDGAQIPSSRVTVSTDLDQVLDVLAPETRTRLAILLDEAGQAVVGRGRDIRQLLGELPRTLADGARLFDGLAADNRRLGMLVERSDRVFANLAPARREARDLIGNFDALARTLARRRQALGITLERAPGTLRALRCLLLELDDTSRPLSPAARNIASTARELDPALAQLRGFTAAAAPTLHVAAGVAPEVSSLATTATPILRRAVPAAEELQQLGRSLKPVSDTLDVSIDNVLAVVDNWGSGAIQMRDSIGHVFRGEAAVTAETVLSMLRRLQPQSRGTAKRKTPQGAPRPERPAPVRPLTVPTPPAAKPSLLAPLQAPIDAVKNALGGLVGGASSEGPTATPSPSKGTADGTSSLLDYLLKP